MMQKMRMVSVKRAPLAQLWCEVAVQGYGEGPHQVTKFLWENNTVLVLSASNRFFPMDRDTRGRDQVQFY